MLAPSPLPRKAKATKKLQNEYALKLLGTAEHLVDSEFREAWAAACYAGMNEALATAKSAYYKLNDHNVTKDLQMVSEDTLKAESLQMCVFSLFFVSLNVIVFVLMTV
ncbi:hypothetical protein BWQ96_04800 [Gracilariopsis chorda]|uniref:Uncharacterized protein n=1 Tax=Gracilariopsis chorda TaxID=448386 RepID=A0A2V3ITS6_9FLOR|nr:hypothetical protein BWQ96_04800 [Gracilariopsis chorda]|eukprot:PXF45502.1 hypothetical protein BWQ96_04800 [Gracilariopsis chorda]